MLVLEPNTLILGTHQGIFDVNGTVMQVAVTPTGRLVVGDMSRGIWISKNGRQWSHTATGMVMGLAVDAHDANRILASGRGIAISVDGGKTWSAALTSKVMFKPIAWAPKAAGVVYAVGYDRSLWKSANSGKTWEACRLTHALDVSTSTRTFD